MDEITLSCERLRFFVLGAMECEVCCDEDCDCDIVSDEHCASRVERGAVIGTSVGSKVVVCIGDSLGPVGC